LLPQEAFESAGLRPVLTSPDPKLTLPEHASGHEKFDRGTMFELHPQTPSQK
jgi:hypothetical protein